MKRRNSLKFLTVALFSFISLLLVGCGSSSAPVVPNTIPKVVNGALVVFAKDAPVCNVVSFTVTITGATLTPQAGGAPVSIIPPASPITVDFARLVEFSTVLNLASVPVGAYSQATLTLSNPQLSVLDVTQSPPVVVTIPTTTLTTATVTFNIDPAVNVAANGSAGLELDFNLRKSVQVDAAGQVTGSVKPTLKASPVNTSNQNPDSLREIDDFGGLVQSVATTNSNNAFTGSVTLLTEDLTSLTVNTTSKTEFDNVAGLSGLALAKGTFVEAHIFVDANGNVVAREIEAEEQEDEGQKKSAFAGLVSSVTRDSSGKATQFTMFVRGEMPDQGNRAPIKSILTVNVPNSTVFKLNAREANRAGLSFNAGAIGMGQEVVVHGKLRDGVVPPTVDAGLVYLRLQSIIGNFATPLLAKQSDNKTGGFTLVSCAAIFRGQPITIFTFAQTSFKGISDLTGLTPPPTVVVRGLLFYQQEAATVNGIAVTPPKMVFEATDVHQLSD